jgi:cell shape-determining protein MreD
MEHDEMDMRTWQRLLGLLVCGFGLGIIEVSFLPILPSPWRAFHLALLISILFILLSRRPINGIILGFLSGLVIDLFPIQYPTFASLRFVMIALGILMLARRFLTHRSLPSFVLLILLSQIADQAWMWSARFMYHAIYGFENEVPSGFAFLQTALWNIVITIGTFSIWRVIKSDFAQIADRVENEHWI